MRYLIGTIFAIVTLILGLMLGYCLYLSFTDGINWIFVALGIAFSFVVALAATTAAFSAAKDY